MNKSVATNLKPSQLLLVLISVLYLLALISCSIITVFLIFRLCLIILIIGNGVYHFLYFAQYLPSSEIYLAYYQDKWYFKKRNQYNWQGQLIGFCNVGRYITILYLKELGEKDKPPQKYALNFKSISKSKIIILTIDNLESLSAYRHIRQILKTLKTTLNSR